MKLEPEQVFDSVCLANFWNKEKEKLVLSAIQLHAVSAKDGITEFVDLLDKYDAEFELTVVTDNPSFDLYFLNYYVEKHLNRKPLNYKFGTGYRPIMDSNSTLKGWLGYRYSGFKKTIVFPGVKADHYPENDAEFIYMCIVYHRGFYNNYW